MPTFEHTFTVAAPRADVASFHGDARVLKRLMPPPLFVHLHQGGELSEGTVADFTMWFGPLPVRWRALHVDVDEAGFTDVQIRGPLRRWRHTHRFIPLDEYATRVEDYVVYEHPAGPRGWLTRLLFNRKSLTFLFRYRQAVTRRALSQPQERWSPVTSALLNVAAGAALLSLLFLFWHLSQKTTASDRAT
ncbi:MAG: SRPBCC family protein [Candidatus Promineifilaceae bacterium]|nr:SRPBCC family protein [Candidatus Promineifilaceae bacterium]